MSNFGDGGFIIVTSDAVLRRKATFQLYILYTVMYSYSEYSDQHHYPTYHTHHILHVLRWQHQQV